MGTRAVRIEHVAGPGCRLSHDPRGEYPFTHDMLVITVEGFTDADHPAEPPDPGMPVAEWISAAGETSGIAFLCALEEINRWMFRARSGS